MSHIVALNAPIIVENQRFKLKKVIDIAYIPPAVNSPV